MSQPNGFPVDPHIVADFLCLQFFGAYCAELTPAQQNAAQQQAAILAASQR